MNKVSLHGYEVLMFTERINQYKMLPFGQEMTF